VWTVAGSSICLLFAVKIESQDNSPSVVRGRPLLGVMVGIEECKLYSGHMWLRIVRQISRPGEYKFRTFGLLVGTARKRG
jgi:hypothetical protein